MLYICLSLLGGLILGSILTSLFWIIVKNKGTFKIDYSNPNKDIFRLEMKDLGSIDKNRYIVLSVKKDTDLSQK